MGKIKSSRNLEKLQLLHYKDREIAPRLNSKEELNPLPVRLFSSLPLLSCHSCERKFTGASCLTRHVSLVHGRAVTDRTGKGDNFQAPFQECEVCHKKFRFAASVKKHMWLFHREGQNNIIKSEPNVSNNLEKKSAIIKEKLEDIKCQLCGKYCPNWKKLQLHMLDHTSDRPYKCDECGKGFKEEAKLKRHKIIHTGEKPFQCAYCSKAFSLKQNKEIHERLHTGDGFPCSYCGEIFTQKVNLKKHQSKHIKLRHVVTENTEIRKMQSDNIQKTKLKPRNYKKVEDLRTSEIRLHSAGQQILMVNNSEIADTADEGVF